MKQKAFTLVETLIAIAIIGLAIGLLVSVVNFTSPLRYGRAQAAAAKFVAAEAGVNAYVSERGSYPSSVSASPFVPSYSVGASVPEGFDPSFGMTTGESAVGHWLCMRTYVSGPTSSQAQDVYAMTAHASDWKLAWGESCGLSARDDPSSAGYLYVTWWMSRN